MANLVYSNIALSQVGSYEAAVSRQGPEPAGSEASPGASWLGGDDSPAAAATAATAARGAETTVVSRLAVFVRGCFLIAVFLIPLMTAGVAYLSSWFRRKVWYAALTRSIALSGTAFIKWGQWSSTRPDMFPEELCACLSVLHKGAPSHSYAWTETLVERAYGGRKIGQVFDWFDTKPLASGSIAQVHKAVLQGEVVAVKVRHPRVKERIVMDFIIMKKIADFVDARPKLKWINLGPSMEQFSHTMTAQTNLLLEATNLDTFNANFRDWKDCFFPRVIHRAEDVLVETFEEGFIASDYVKMFQPSKLNGNPGLWEWAQLKMIGRPAGEVLPVSEKPDPALGHFIVTRGEDLWLKMVLSDGLLHADLHPGNILIYAPQDRNAPPHLVLVDAGLVANLEGEQKRNFIQLLECLGAGDGVGAARVVLKFSSNQTCVGAEEQAAFCKEMDALFRDRCRGYGTNVDVGEVLRGVLTCVRKYRVRVDVEYATLILNILCLESMAKALSPTYNVLDGAQPLLELHKMGGRLVGSAGVRFMLPLARAAKSRRDKLFLRRLVKHHKDTEREAARKDQILTRAMSQLAEGTQETTAGDCGTATTSTVSLFDGARGVQGVYGPTSGVAMETRSMTGRGDTGDASLAEGEGLLQRLGDDHGDIDGDGGGDDVPHSTVQAPAHWERVTLTDQPEDTVLEREEWSSACSSRPLETGSRASRNAS